MIGNEFRILNSMYFFCSFFYALRVYLGPKPYICVVGLQQTSSPSSILICPFPIENVTANRRANHAFLTLLSNIFFLLYSYTLCRTFWINVGLRDSCVWYGKYSVCRHFQLMNASLPSQTCHNWTKNGRYPKNSRAFVNACEDADNNVFLSFCIYLFFISFALEIFHFLYFHCQRWMSVHRGETMHRARTYVWYEYEITILFRPLFTQKSRRKKKKECIEQWSWEKRESLHWIVDLMIWG